LAVDHAALVALVNAIYYAAEEQHRRDSSRSALPAGACDEPLKQPQIVSPLLLVLLQLCGELAPTLGVIKACLWAVQTILCLQPVAASLGPSQTSATSGAAATAEASAPHPAAAAGAGTSDSVLSALLLPLLHTLGPAVTKAARKLDMGCSEEEYSRMCPGQSLQADAERAAEFASGMYGVELLQILQCESAVWVAALLDQPESLPYVCCCRFPGTSTLDACRCL
jgi:hypothetical protein